MSFFNKIKQGASKASEVAQQTVELTRLNATVSLKRHEIEKLYKKLGQMVYEATYTVLDVNEETVQQTSQEIHAHFAEIEKLSDQILFIKKEKKCVCGKVVEWGTGFCSACGHRFDSPPEVQQ